MKQCFLWLLLFLLPKIEACELKEDKLTKENCLSAIQEILDKKPYLQSNLNQKENKEFNQPLTHLSQYLEEENKQKLFSACMEEKATQYNKQYTQESGYAPLQAQLLCLAIEYDKWGLAGFCVDKFLEEGLWSVKIDCYYLQSYSNHPNCHIDPKKALNPLKQPESEAAKVIKALCRKELLFVQAIFDEALNQKAFNEANLVLQNTSFVTQGVKVELNKISMEEFYRIVDNDAWESLAESFLKHCDNKRANELVKLLNKKFANKSANKEKHILTCKRILSYLGLDTENPWSLVSAPLQHKLLKHLMWTASWKEVFLYRKVDKFWVSEEIQKDVNKMVNKIYLYCLLILTIGCAIYLFAKLRQPAKSLGRATY